MLRRSSTSIPSTRTELDLMKVVIALLVLFVGFWTVQAPNSLAEFAQESGAWIWDMTTMVFAGVIDFLDALFD